MREIFSFSPSPSPSRSFSLASNIVMNQQHEQPAFGRQEIVQFDLEIKIKYQSQYLLIRHISMTRKRKNYHQHQYQYLAIDRYRYFWSWSCCIDASFIFLRFFILEQTKIKVVALLLYILTLLFCILSHSV